jgi:hypothetical protein
MYNVPYVYVKTLAIFVTVSLVIIAIINKFVPYSH